MDGQPHQPREIARLWVGDGRIAVELHGQAFRLQALENFVGAVRAAIIDNNELVEELAMMAYERLDDVALVPHSADRDQRHENEKSTQHDLRQDSQRVDE